MGGEAELVKGACPTAGLGSVLRVGESLYPSGSGAPMRPKGNDRTAPHSPGRFGTMKKLLELLVCFIHPLAVVLMWIDLASRRDMASGPKMAWAILGLIPLVPFLYVLTGGDLW